MRTADATHRLLDCLHTALDQRDKWASACARTHHNTQGHKPSMACCASSRNMPLHTTASTHHQCQCGLPEMVRDSCAQALTTSKITRRMLGSCIGTTDMDYKWMCSLPYWQQHTMTNPSNRHGDRFFIHRPKRVPRPETWALKKWMILPWCANYPTKIPAASILLHLYFHKDAGPPIPPFRVEAHSKRTS